MVDDFVDKVAETFWRRKRCISISESRTGNIHFTIKKGICKKWDPRLETVGGTRDARPGTHLIGRTQDPRHRTLKVGPET